eukprot:3068747-Amphidinium_carterae.2
MLQQPGVKAASTVSNVQSEYACQMVPLSYAQRAAYAVLRGSASSCHKCSGSVSGSVLQWQACWSG